MGRWMRSIAFMVNGLKDEVPTGQGVPLITRGAFRRITGCLINVRDISK